MVPAALERLSWRRTLGKRKDGHPAAKRTATQKSCAGEVGSGPRKDSLGLHEEKQHSGGRAAESPESRTTSLHSRNMSLWHKYPRLVCTCLEELSQREAQPEGSVAKCRRNDAFLHAVSLAERMMICIVHLAGKPWGQPCAACALPGKAGANVDISSALRIAEVAMAEEEQDQGCGGCSYCYCYATAMLLLCYCYATATAAAQAAEA